jgi:hypothetical protein
MGRFTVYRDTIIPGTNVECTVGSMSNDEARQFQEIGKEDKEELAWAVASHVYAKDSPLASGHRVLLFKDAKEFLRELSPGQMTHLLSEINKATAEGMPEAAARFRDGDGEAGSVQPVPDGGDVGVPAE